MSEPDPRRRPPSCRQSPPTSWARPLPSVDPELLPTTVRLLADRRHGSPAPSIGAGRRLDHDDGGRFGAGRGARPTNRRPRARRHRRRARHRDRRDVFDRDRHAHQQPGSAVRRCGLDRRQRNRTALAPSCCVATPIRRPVTLAPAWLLYWQPGTDRFWRLDEVSRFGDPLHIAEITYDGTPTGVEFESDGRYWMAAADPLGGLLVLGAPGGSYRIAPEGTSRITTGDVIAIERRQGAGDRLRRGDGGLRADRDRSRRPAPRRHSRRRSQRRHEHRRSSRSSTIPRTTASRRDLGDVAGRAVRPIMVLDTGPGLRRDRSDDRRVHPARRPARVVVVVVARQPDCDVSSTTAISWRTTSTPASTYEISTDLFPLQDFAVRPPGSRRSR